MTTESPLSLADATSQQPEPAFPADAPNVVVIVLDDLGFAQLGCYGSDIETPNLDRVAERGVRFSNFHTTAVCSPTRACLLTGRNHHRVGMGMLPDLPLNFPGYTGEFPPSAGTLPAILRDNGWATYAIGKWHLVGRDQRAVGPYDMWPTGVGFERYYGFLNGETNQWTPNLIRDQAHVEPPSKPEDGYHLDADLADEAIAHIDQLRLAQPSRPFLLWYATAAPHAPHQAPPEWIDRYAGRFDAGWDHWRADVLTRQKEAGVVPANTELSARPDWVEAWDDLDDERRRLYSRMMEVFAGFVSHADHHIGRVIEHIESIGELDNTIVMVTSDNGCSAEGGPNGSWNQIRHYISDDPDDIDLELEHFDDLGGFRSSGHYPWGWALAGNTPFRRWKRYTYEGGVRDPLIISWPQGIGGDGGVRDQYCHVTDLMPTLLDLVGIEPPATLRGVAQMSLDGTTIRPAIDDPHAPATRTKQYYECWGSRAMYADGWKAVTDHVNQLTAAERAHIKGSSDFAHDRWALFDTSKDFTESHDLAEAEPERLARLVELWHEEAERNHVLPIDDGQENRLAHMRMRWAEFSTRYQYRPGDKVHESHSPVLSGGFALTAAFDPPTTPNDAGVLCEQGDWISGWAVWLGGGGLHFATVISGREYSVVAQLPEEWTTLGVRLRPIDTGMVVELRADGTRLIDSRFGTSQPNAWAPDGAFLTVGYGRPFPVSDRYDPTVEAPSSFRGIAIEPGAPAEIDAEEEFSRIMRHQ